MLKYVMIIAYLIYISLSQLFLIFNTINGLLNPAIFFTRKETFEDHCVTHGDVDELLRNKTK